jgi:hypothetical protein
MVVRHRHHRGFGGDCRTSERKIVMPLCEKCGNVVGEGSVCPRPHDDNLPTADDLDAAADEAKQKEATDHANPKY